MPYPWDTESAGKWRAERLLLALCGALAIWLCASDVAGAARVKADARRDVWAAIRQVFPMDARADARCIVTKEVGRGHASRWRKVYRGAVGRAGEVGPWQAHPGWWRTGWNGRPPLWPRVWKIRHDALYATKFALWLWKRSGERWRLHWPLTARACGLR